MNMKLHRIIAGFLAALCLPLSVAFADDQELGSISFPNSGAADAQSAFLTGVKALHSFQFDEARFAFEEAQKIDSSFALAYWGQAMSDNHPLWAQQDMDAATAALKRLAPTFKGRLAKAETEKEKAFLTAIETLYYSADDKLKRDFAYSEQMARMHERWPEDDEVSVFYALSLLGTVRPGDQGYRRQVLAASIAQSVYAKNEQHPGGAHFIIHSFDDPDHAILALPAAKVYAEIAPASAHALHMPSHIFLQLGRWQGVVDSNIDAYSAALATNKKFGLAEGREDFHTLSWRAYAYLMLGNFDEAANDLALAKDTMARNPDSARVHGGYLNILGRHVLETEQWADFKLEPIESVEGSHANWVSVVGMSAAHSGDSDLASKAINRLVMLADAANADGNMYGAKQIAILQKETMAVLSLANGDADAAVAHAREAAQMEMRDMQAPSGPPIPMKPAAELYADILLAADRPVEAVAAYEQSLQWVPLRTPSIAGLARAAASSGDAATAEEMLSKLKAMPGISKARTVIR
jgi:tetratricopeptide (TPR) repeat protein